MSREQCMWIVPPVKGQVVMLNMESDQFNELKEYFGGMEGYVLDHETHVISNWVRMSEHDKARATALIQIGEKTLNVRLFNLVPISNLFVDLHKVSFVHGEVITLTNLDMKKKLDYHLIEKGRHVRSKTHFTEKHRKECFQLCANRFTSDILADMNEYQLATYEALAIMGIDLPTSTRTPEPMTPRQLIDSTTFSQAHTRAYDIQSELARVANLLSTPVRPLTEGAVTVLQGTAGNIITDDILAFLDDTPDDEEDEEGYDEEYFDEEDEF